MGNAGGEECGDGDGALTVEESVRGQVKVIG